jgi:hypothetical protein
MYAGPLRQQALAREDLLGLLVARLGKQDLVILLVDVEVARRFRLVGLLLFLLARKQRRHLVHAQVDLGAVFGLAGDDERGARFVDEDRVHLVDDGVMQAALEALLHVHRHVVAQVVEAELVVRAVGDVGGVGSALILRIHLRQVDTHRQPEEVEHLAHPLRIAARQVIVHRHDVHAPAGERVEIGGQRRDEGLAFAGLHLGDLAVVQDHAAEELDIEMTHAQRALRRLAHDRESFGEELVERCAVGMALLQRIGLAAQFRIGQLAHVRLEGVDPRHGERILLQESFVAAAENAGRQPPRGLEEIAKSFQDLAVKGNARENALDPQKRLILAGTYLARATAGWEFDTRNLEGFCGAPRKRTSKCRCGPVERPVEPTSPILRPRWTRSPSRTTSLEQCA